MAEREGAGLDILIKQRISRPSFARMISWEIEKVSNCPPKKHRTSSRQKKADQSQAPDGLEENESKEEEDGGSVESEGDSNDSEDSEYFSAEENVPCTGQDESDDKVGTNPDEKEAVLEQAEHLLSAQLTNITLDTTSSRHNRKAPSKKQKKKRRRQQPYRGVEHYAEFLAPFRNVENINFGVEELRGDLLSKSTDTVAEVPTLFEHCIRTIWRKNQQTILGFELLPGPIKHSVSSWGQRRAFTSMQLSCLYRVLAVVEKEIKEFSNVLWFPTRNVWSLGRLDLTGPSSPVHIVGNEVSAVIPYTYASCGYCDSVSSGLCRQKTSENYLFPLYTLSLLVNVLDLMIPTHLHTKKRKEALTGEETDRAVTAAVLTTLNHLKTRYPDVIKLCQDRALPYVYWLRGHNRLALDEFLRLAESAPSCKEKNYHLLEAARLCRLQNQEDAARKLYREVQDQLIVLPGVWGIENAKSEIDLQTLMLCANTYDQGLMSEQKAVASLKAWRLLKNVPARVEQAESFFPAVDALLCYHLAHLPGKTAAEKLSGVVDFLKIAATKCADLRLHLSLVYAWMGQQSESLKAYQGLMTFGGTPGMEFKPEAMHNTDYTPWYPVLEAVGVAGCTPPRPLQVVWRTQLGNLRVIKDLNVFEGDLSGRLLNLRISTDGHLTGDLHLLLPPVKAINLDLYTGRLVLPSFAGQTNISKTVFNSILHSENAWNEFQNGPYAVTLTELYSDDQARSVHLMAALGAGVLFAENTPAHIQWTNNQGQRCKLSIMNVLKKAVFEETKKIIQNTCTRENDLVAALKGLEYAFSHSLQMEYNRCVRIGNYLLEMEMPKEEKKKLYVYSRYSRYRRYKYPKRDPRKDLERESVPFFICLQDFVSYGSILVLWGKCNQDRTHVYFFLFFDVSSKESFQNPVIQLSTNYSDLHVKILSRQKHIVPRAQVLCVSTIQASEQNLMLFGPDAKPVHNWREGLGPPYDVDSFCILGNSVYRVQNPESQEHPDQAPSLIEVRYGHEGHECTSFFHNLDLNLRQVKVIMDNLLLVCTDGLRVLCPRTLELLPLIQGPNSNCQLPFSDDGMVILVQDPHVNVLEEKSVITSSGLSTTFVAVAVDNFLLMLAAQEGSKLEHPIMEVVFCVKIAGHATEICFLSQTVGYLVSTTMHTGESKQFYRETVYHLSPGGQLMGLLPCLGPGPREFCPVYLPPARCSESDNGEGGAELQGAAWHVFMRDGHEGIIAIRL